MTSFIRSADADRFMQPEKNILIFGKKENEMLAVDSDFAMFLASDVNDLLASVHTQHF